MNRPVPSEPNPVTATDQIAWADWGSIGRRLHNLISTPTLGPVSDRAPTPAPGTVGNRPEPSTAAHALDRLIPHLPRALSSAASPERALNNFERFLQALPAPAPVLAALGDDLHILEMLAHLFAGSQFLTEILLRNPGYLSLLTERTGIAHLKTPGRFLAEARTATDPWLTGGNGGSTAYPAVLDALRRYQQRELLRIGICDLNGLLELPAVTTQLSYLAETVIQTALEVTAAQTGISPAGFAVLAMGKLGGGELNYSSDVDLLFLVGEGYGETHMRAYTRLGERLIGALTDATAEGFLYRVDMRLRPWGKVGPLAPTVNGYLRYLQQHARLWEKQALLRGRVVAGDELVGGAFIARAEPLLFASGPEAVRAEVYGMKQLTESHLRQTGRIWGEVKLGEGSIRDVEFVAQYLQLAYGDTHPELRSGNTLAALARLTDNGFLSFEDHRILSEGYTFLRTVEHYLQLLDYRQTHVLPEDAADLRYLARRLGFEGRDAGQDFVAQYQQHSAAVRGVYLRHLAAAPAAAAAPPVAVAPPANDTIVNHHDRARGTAMPLDPPVSALAHEHMQRMSADYRATFEIAEIERHAEMAAALTSEQPVGVIAALLPAGAAGATELWRVTIVGYDYLGVLSLIGGLFFAYGFSIVDGNVHTYEPGGRADSQRKIVDVFTVEPVRLDENRRGTPDLWQRYAADLTGLLRHLQARQPRVAQGELAKRIAATLRASPTAPPTLPPVDIEIDNDASAAYTVLRISGADTPGFLYEFTNALALNRIHIAQVSVTSARDRVQDTLYVTDDRGQKITSEARQRELRAATVLVKHFTHLLPRSPNPESALLHFNEYLGELFGRPSWPDELASLERPEVLDALARLLGVSEFLWDDFLRMQYANLFPVVANVDTLAAARSCAELAAALAANLENGQAGTGDWRDALNAFKDREMFRIDMRHILGHVPAYADFARELTDLAEVVLAAAVERCHAELAAQYGMPEPGRYCLAALGKAGGRELGFASDIELMFVYEAAGNTAGPRVIAAGEFYEKLVVELGRAIRARREGIFEIDLQLRPYGKAGSLAVSLDAFRRYFAPGGPAWGYERQALVKLRPIAGDPALGEQLTELRDSYVYTATPFDVAAMRAMRERQLRHLVTPGNVNAKFSRGGLVDVEYIVQGLQVTHGHRDPALRVTNTADAIAALARAGIISDENAARLSGALVFLQQLINALRMVRGNNKDLTVPPPGGEEFAFLARRLGYDSEPGRLSAALEEHLGWVQRLSARLLG